MYLLPLFSATEVQEKLLVVGSDELILHRVEGIEALNIPAIDGIL
jgi:hypothetical protein